MIDLRKVVPKDFDLEFICYQGFHSSIDCNIEDSFTELELKAARFADKWHKGQVRKYTGLPYITHPFDVVCRMKPTYHTQRRLVIAWLHDVLEDTGCDFIELWSVFGYEVARDVLAITKDGRYNQLSRKERNEQYNIQLANAPYRVQYVKAFDIMSNCSDIVLHDPKFAKVYLFEKMETVYYLDKLAKGFRDHLLDYLDCQYKQAMMR